MSECVKAGLGNMGLPMAGNLQQYLTKQFHDGAFAPSLFVHNRTLSKADALVEQGATKADSIEGATPLCCCTRHAGHHEGPWLSWGPQEGAQGSCMCLRMRSGCAVLAKKCTIVFSMVLDDAAVTSAVDAFLAATPRPGSIWVDCSTGADLLLALRRGLHATNKLRDGNARHVPCRAPQCIPAHQRRWPPRPRATACCTSPRPSSAAPRPSRATRAS